MAPKSPAAGPDAGASAVPEPPAVPAAQVPDTVRGQYTGETPRTYRFPGGAITVQQGDVCDVPGTELPADGLWMATTADVTRLPDNHHDNSPLPYLEADPTLVASSFAEQEEIYRRLGLLDDQEPTAAAEGEVA